MNKVSLSELRRQIEAASGKGIRVLSPNQALILLSIAEAARKRKQSWEDAHNPWNTLPERAEGETQLRRAEIALDAALEGITD